MTKEEIQKEMKEKE
jgi:hypothetical protein